MLETKDNTENKFIATFYGNEVVYTLGLQYRTDGLRRRIITSAKYVADGSELSKSDILELRELEKDRIIGFHLKVTLAEKGE